MRRPLLACALALGLAGCSSSNGSTPDAGTIDTCSSDAECQAGFKCDRQQRRCVCTGDQACPSGSFCNAFTGACVASVPGCTADSACAKSEFCDRAVRSCKPLTSLCGACKTDAQCGAGSKCAAHPSYPTAGTFCVPQCGTADGGAASCGSGLVCLGRDQTPSAEKLCYPAAGACGVSNACTPDSRKLCQQDTDCGDAAQVCDGTIHSCVAKVRSCPAGDACDPQQRICVAACSRDEDCKLIEGKAGFQCISNACVQRALCNADADCTDGQDCQANPDGSKSCAAGCVVNTDCPLGQSCNKTDPKHPKCAQGCAASADCPLNAICIDGACSSTRGAPQSCSQTCQATQVCPIAASCDGSSCCSAATLGAGGSSQCWVTDSVATGQNTAPCARCTAAGGCPAQDVNQCGNNCFPLNLKSCASQNDCAGLPGTVCTPAGICQTTMHVLPCNGDSDCPWKGFRCLPKARFCGSGYTDSICIPDAQSAQVACLQGHP